MRKKIAILVYSLASGGAERVVSILLNELKDKYSITLFLMNDTIFYDIPKNIKLVFLEKSKPKERGLIKLIKLPWLAWKYKKLNSNEISMSFMNRSNYINIIAKMLGMKSKVIISERAMPSLQHELGIQGKINKILIKNLYSRADVITANSLGNCRDLQYNYGCTKVIMINNLIEIDQFKQLSSQKKDYRDNEFTFITVGRLDSGKNHKLIIEAIKNIEAKLYIIGDGELRNYLENYVIENRLEEKVIFLGRQLNPYAYMVQADCFVFSSLYEGFPNVLLEALACELPIISSDCLSGPREILAPNSDLSSQIKSGIEKCEYGLLSTVNDKDALVKAMSVLKEDESLRKNYKTKALSRAKYFSKENIINKWIEIIET